MCTQQATSTPTATSSATPTPSPTQGCGAPNPSCATPTPVYTPTISVQNVYRCSKLGEGRRTNGEAMPGYRCIGKDPCTPCEVECGHPSSVIDERETGGTSIIQYNRARTYFPSRMPEWPGGGTNYKPAPGTLDKACNLAGFLEHVSSTSTAWSSPGDNFLIYWDGAQRRFVKARGNTQGGRWAGSIRCKGLLHPSCRGPANLRWVFD
jgi:hypothetical protein